MLITAVTTYQAEVLHVVGLTVVAAERYASASLESLKTNSKPVKEKYRF